ncbi:VanZ family protein [Phenylobacterium sp.]|uniref:VanZ family protein n=1 Tax=Phenylobacterium sp. TaxID=1871053 RepID=UPI00286C2B6E|nr:VanZ family protein [Phenylobacterium sp.]
MVPTSQKAARFLLIAAGAICVIGMVGPFQGVEENFVPADKAAHFIAFYGLTALMMAAFRKNRRLEIALAAALVGGSIEIAQMVVGRGVSLGDLAADTAGAFAVWIPMWLQSLRSAPYEERRAGAGAKAAEIA